MINQDYLPEWGTGAKNGSRSVLLRSDEVGRFKLTDSKKSGGTCPGEFLTKFIQPGTDVAPDIVEAVIKHLDTLDAEIRSLLANKNIKSCSQSIQNFVRKHAEAKEARGARLYKRHVDDIVTLHMGDFQTAGFKHNPVALYLLKITCDTKACWLKGVDNAQTRETIRAENAWRQIRVRA